MKEVLKNRKAAVVGLILAILSFIFICIINFLYKLNFSFIQVLPALLLVALFLGLILKRKNLSAHWHKTYIALNIIFYMFEIIVVIFSFMLLIFSDSEVTVDINKYEKFLFIVRRDNRFDFFPKEISKDAKDIFFYGSTGAIFNRANAVLAYSTSKDELNHYETNYYNNIRDMDINFNDILKNNTNYNSLNWEKMNYKVIITNEYSANFLIGYSEYCDGIIINNDTNQIIFFTGYFLKNGIYIY